jgi:hypothetical protein
MGEMNHDFETTVIKRLAQNWSNWMQTNADERLRTVPTIGVWISYYIRKRGGKEEFVLDEESMRDEFEVMLCELQDDIERVTQTNCNDVKEEEGIWV